MKDAPADLLLSMHSVDVFQRELKVADRSPLIAVSAQPRVRKAQP